MGRRGLVRAWVAAVALLIVQAGPSVADPVVVGTVAVGESPQGVAVTPDGTRAYVTNLSSDTVSVIDTATNSVIGSPIAVGWEPKGIAITPDGSGKLSRERRVVGDGREPIDDAQQVAHLLERVAERLHAADEQQP